MEESEREMAIAIARTAKRELRRPLNVALIRIKVSFDTGRNAFYTRPITRTARLRARETRDGGGDERQHAAFANAVNVN